MGSVRLHLVKLLFLNSGLGLFGVEVGTNLGEGFLGDPSLLLLRGKGLLPPCELLLPC
jgi:hypothetical protein